MQAVGRDMRMKGANVGPVDILIHGRPFTENVYVGPIAGNMLLGLDFMRKHEVQIQIPGSSLCINGELIPIVDDQPNLSLQTNSNDCLHHRWGIRQMTFVEWPCQPSVAHQIGYD